MCSTVCTGHVTTLTESLKCLRCVWWTVSVKWLWEPLGRRHSSSRRSMIPRVRTSTKSGGRGMRGRDTVCIYLYSKLIIEDRIHHMMPIIDRYRKTVALIKTHKHVHRGWRLTMNCANILTIWSITVFTISHRCSPGCQCSGPLWDPAPPSCTALAPGGGKSIPLSVQWYVATTTLAEGEGGMGDQHNLLEVCLICPCLVVTL